MPPVGLIDAIKDRQQAKRYVISANTAPFDLLPATGQIANFTDVLYPEQMQMLLKDLFQAYDLVIFDVPPANPLVDGLALSALFDALVIVAEWGRTPVDLLSEMLRSLRIVKTLILGVIMTKVDDGSVSSYSKHVARY